MRRCLRRIYFNQFCDRICKFFEGQFHNFHAYIKSFIQSTVPCFRKSLNRLLFRLLSHYFTAKDWQCFLSFPVPPSPHPPENCCITRTSKNINLPSACQNSCSVLKHWQQILTITSFAICWGHFLPVYSNTISWKKSLVWKLDASIEDVTAESVHSLFNNRMQVAAFSDSRLFRLLKPTKKTERMSKGEIKHSNCCHSTTKALCILNR